MGRAIEADIDVMQKKLTNLDDAENSLHSSLKNINSSTNTRIDELYKNEINLEKQLSIIGGVQSDQSEKIRALEEASARHFEKAQYFDTLNSRVSQLDEMRQQSEAKARDEVDATLSRNNTVINEFKADFENQIQSINVHLNREYNKVVNDNTRLQSELNQMKEDLSGVSNNMNSSSNQLFQRISQLESDERKTLLN